MVRFIKTSFLVVFCAAMLVSCDLVNPEVDENQTASPAQQSETEAFQLGDILSSESIGQIVGSGPNE